MENILAGAIGSGLGVAIGEVIGTPLANYINTQKTAYNDASSSSQQTSPNQQQSQTQLMQRQGLFGGNNYNSAQTGSVAGDGYGQGNTVGTSLSSQSDFSYGDSLAGIGTLLDDPTLALIGAASPDAQSPQSQFILSTAANMMFWASGEKGNSSNYLTLPSSASEQETAWENGMHVILGTAGMGTGYGEYLNDMSKEWLGMNGKWYSVDWGGNQYTGARSLILEDAAATARAFYMMGVGLFTVDAAVNIYEGIKDIYNGDLVAAGPIGLDVIMGGVGTFGGPPGLIISSAYFLPKFAIENWSTIQSAIEIESEVEEANQELTGRSIYGGPRP